MGLDHEDHGQTARDVDEGQAGAERFLSHGAAI
jgi:hypothetical protein